MKVILARSVPPWNLGALLLVVLVETGGENP
jgi:hypothetical protein